MEQAMLKDFLAIIGFVAAMAGCFWLSAAAGRGIARSIFWAITWMQRSVGRKQYAAKGWNTIPDEIPEDRYVVAVWEGWRPEICQRKGDRIVGYGISFTLDSCIGWLDLPQLQDLNS